MAKSPLAKINQLELTGLTNYGFCWTVKLKPYCGGHFNKYGQWAYYGDHIAIQANRLENRVKITNADGTETMQSAGTFAARNRMDIGVNTH